MKITDLEEAADLTAEKVRAYLERKGWRVRQYDDEYTDYERAADEPLISIHDTDINIAANRVEYIALIERRTPQSLLREICPRWAPFPSAESIRAHGGRWMRTREHDGQTIIDIVSLDGGSDGLPPGLRAKARYWPVNEHGDRGPMPRDASGKEL